MADDKIWVTRDSGLVEQRPLAVLDIEHSIDRSHERRPDGRLMLPKREEFLPTEPYHWPGSTLDLWMSLPSEIPWEPVSYCWPSP